MLLRMTIRQARDRKPRADMWLDTIQKKSSQHFLAELSPRSVWLHALAREGYASAARAPGQRLKGAGH